MAAKAFVLIETVQGTSKEVVTAIRQLGGVKSVDTVTGPYEKSPFVLDMATSVVASSKLQIARRAG